MSNASRLLFVAATVLCVADLSAAADELGKVTGQTTFLSVNGKTYGFIGMVLLEIDGKPAACFGLHKPPDGKPRYTYLILFKPDPKSDSRFGVEGGDKDSQIGSNGKVVCDLKMKAHAQGREVEVEYKLRCDAKDITSETLKVGGKESGKDGPRVFLVDLAEEKPKCVAIKLVPKAVPDFIDEKSWGREIVQAVKELKETSPEAKEFFVGKKYVRPPQSRPQSGSAVGGGRRVGPDPSASGRGRAGTSGGAGGSDGGHPFPRGAVARAVRDASPRRCAGPAHGAEG
jgi:hypothetical protein